MWLRRFVLVLILWGCQLGVGSRLTTPAALAIGMLIPSVPYASMALPPLPRGCGGAGTPIDYLDPVCCVSGYVYYAGQPVVGANVIIQINERQQSVQTRREPGHAQPYYTASLHGEPLRIKPGDPVTVTAQFGGQAITTHFVAQAGGQQIDLVIPTEQADSTWLPGSLSARHNHAVANDVARQQVVLFGGLTQFNLALADTWLWDGQSWRAQNPATTPPPRAGHALVYEAAHQRVLLFGGQDQTGAYRQDLWVWDGVNWTELHPLTLPPARAGHALAYDAAHQQVVLFGGANGGGALNDTWLWDGSTWQVAAASPAPPKRLHHALTYDGARQQLLLYGGQTDAQPAQVLGDLWAWTGSQWTLLSSASMPPPLQGHTLVYDASRQQVVLFGGVGADNNPLATTWLWDGSRWQAAASGSTPPVRSGHGMVYDTARQQVLIVGGQQVMTVLADTWLWDGGAWREQAAVAPFTRWQGVGVTDEGNGQLLLFGGLLGNALAGVPQRETFRWRDQQWTRLAPATIPPPRYGHRLARNQDGSRLLLFGGLTTDIFYLSDTWLWQGKDWLPVAPAMQPPPRAYYALTYAADRGVWVLFGGRNDQGLTHDRYWNDLWEFNGTEWRERITPVAPAPRALATLTYDPQRQQSILFGGADGQHFFDDLWAWDGTTWQALAPAFKKPLPRAGHGASYDPDQQVLVIAGGNAGSAGPRQDTWVWDGVEWQERHSAPRLPALYSLTLAPDPANQQLVALGEQIGSNLNGEGLWLHKVLTGIVEAPPVATISHVNLRDGRQGSDTFRFTGRGADGDAAVHPGSAEISRYLWSHQGVTLSTQITLALPAAALPLGEQTLAFQVQDNEGDWSLPVTQTVFVREAISSSLPLTQPTWTLLIYAVGDNSLAPRLEDNPLTLGLLYRLRTAGAAAHVQVGVLYDGPGRNDTQRYILDDQGGWHGEVQAEADMGQMETLLAFLDWGVGTLPGDYVVLALVDHANGLVGFGRDEQSASELDPLELRTALQGVVDAHGRKIDVLQVDGSSFGLLEAAAIAGGLVNYMVVSPNTRWSIYAYDRYRRLLAAARDPRAYAQTAAQTYAELAAARSLPYTSAVYDLAQLDELTSAVGQLGHELATYIKRDPSSNSQYMYKLRSQLQRYDSGGLLPNQPDAADAYVDLLDLATQAQTLADPAIQAAAAQVATEVKNLVIYEKSAAGAYLLDNKLVQLDLRSSGIVIFYPLTRTAPLTSTYQLYVNHRLFPITVGWGWPHFLQASVPALPIGESMPPDVLLAPLAYDARHVYLPLVSNR